MVWWSAWLSIAWGAWWIGLAIGMMTPKLFKYSIGVVLPPNFVERWYGYLLPMKKVIMGAVWAFLSWCQFLLSLSFFLSLFLGGERFLVEKEIDKLMMNSKLNEWIE